MPISFSNPTDYTELPVASLTPAAAAGKVTLDMGHRNVSVVAPRWLLLILTLVLMLGHVCELSAYVDLAVSPHLIQGDGHAAHDKAHDHAMSCDPVDAVASRGFVGGAVPVLGVTQATLIYSLQLDRFVTPSFENAKQALSRPPLFLLHVSLLI
jgi:hypothetical protein